MPGVFSVAKLMTMRLSAVPLFTVAVLCVAAAVQGGIANAQVALADPQGGQSNSGEDQPLVCLLAPPGSAQFGSSLAIGDRHLVVGGTGDPAVVGYDRDAITLYFQEPQ